MSGASVNGTNASATTLCRGLVLLGQNHQERAPVLQELCRMSSQLGPWLASSLDMSGTSWSNDYSNVYIHARLCRIFSTQLSGSDRTSYRSSKGTLVIHKAHVWSSDWSIWWPYMLLTSHFKVDLMPNEITEATTHDNESFYLKKTTLPLHSENWMNFLVFTFCLIWVVK